MIKPLTESEMMRPLDTGKKVNELIEAFNNLEYFFGHHGHTVFGEADLERGHITGPPIEARSSNESLPIS